MTKSLEKFRDDPKAWINYIPNMKTEDYEVMTEKYFFKYSHIIGTVKRGAFNEEIASRRKYESAHLTLRKLTTH